MATSDEMLRSKTDGQLRAALISGAAQLALLGADDFRDPSDDFDGPFPPSKASEQWTEDFNAEMRRKLNFGMSLVREELARRTASAAIP